jgi:hypothetical protein
MSIIQLKSQLVKQLENRKLPPQYQEMFDYDPLCLEVAIKLLESNTPPLLFQYLNLSANINAPIREKFFHYTFCEYLGDEIKEAYQKQIQDLM